MNEKLAAAPAVAGAPGWHRAMVAAIGLLAGAAGGMDALAGADDPRSFSTAEVAGWIAGGAGVLALALVLIHVGMVRLVRRLDLPADARRRFYVIDLLTFAIALVTFLGAVGVQFIGPVIAGVVVLFVGSKSLALCAAMGREQRRTMFSSLGYLAFLFLISGFAALIYQIVWERTLFAAFGVNVESITIIVSLFMFGLGIGSMVGGILSRKFPQHGPTLFLSCELGIGAFGLLSLPLIDHVSTLALHGSLVTVSAAIFGLLCLPTMLMGATLPILVSHLHRHYKNVGKSVGILYCINTVGSAIACFITADLLFIYLGQQGAVYVAAVCNITVGVLVSLYARRIARQGTEARREERRSDEATERRRDEEARRHEGTEGRRLTFFVLFFSAASGYISLSEEMLWMRAVSYMTGGSPAVFAHVLGFFLVGVALGALFAERLCERRFTREGSSPVRFVGAMLIISAVFYYLSIAITAKLLTISGGLGMAAVYVIVTIVSFLLGGVFPVLCHYGTRAGQAVGLAVSRLYLANIVGCTLGPLLTGFVLMEYLPTDRIILCISIGTLVLGAAAYFFEPGKRAIAPSVAAACGIAALLLAHPALYGDLLEKLHYKTHYTPKAPYKEVIQNRSGIIAVAPEWTHGADMLYGGGMYDGNFNIDPVYDDNTISRAYMIAALHDRPEEVLEIGLASGSWSRVMAAYEPVRRHVIVEINPGYLGLIAEYSPQKDLLDKYWADGKRVSIEIDDGRRWLKRHPEQQFDFILQNTTWHWRSEITNLLSVEYMKLCKEHLKPGGVIYFNTTGSHDVAYTAARVFQHIVRYKKFIAASDAPFDLGREQIRANLLKFKFDGKGIFDTTDTLMRGVMERLAAVDLTDLGPALRASTDLRLITDDNMLTEYKRQWTGEGDWGEMRVQERGKVLDGARTWASFFAARR